MQEWSEYALQYFTIFVTTNGVTVPRSNSHNYENIASAIRGSTFKLEA